MSESKSSGSKKSSASADKDSEPKPVVITHRPILTAPTYKGDSNDEEESTEPAKKLSGSGGMSRIEPTGNVTLEDIPEEKPPDKPETKDEPKEKVADLPAMPTVDTAEPTEDSKTDVTDSQTKSDTEVRDDDSPDDEDHKEGNEASAEAAEAVAAEKQAAHDAEIQKLVDEKTYFLPINSVEKRRTKRFILLGILVSLLLTLTWVDVALDAGLIQIGNIKPVTHFFSN